MLKSFSKTFGCGFHTRRPLRNNHSWLEEISVKQESPSLPTSSFIIKNEEDVVNEINDIPLQVIDLDENNRFLFRQLGEDDFGFGRTLVKLSDYFFGNTHQSMNAIMGEKSIKRAQKVERKAFQDLKVIRVSSGKGGNGAISFFRDANQPSGPPDGGDGGSGGNVYLKVVETMGSLHRIRRTYVAKGGQPGKGSQLDGKRGEDVLIEVPKGTTLRWIPDPLVLRESFKTTNKQSTWLEILTSYSGQYIQFFRNSFKPGEGWLFSEHDEEYFKERDFFVKLDETVQGYDQEIINEELTEDYFPILGMDLDDVTDKPILLLKGGRGGMGNMNFLTKDVRNPRFAKKGRDGNVQFFLLELKLIADLGLVGLPNAGKSSLLRSISRARPRVGHWEFTTLQPTIGTIYTTIDKDPFTVADIPGIIKGASENKGMGLDFLRHIERCKGLVFVVSLEKSPIEDLRILIEELGETKLKNKRKLIIATKADLNDNNKTYTKFKEYIETHLNIEGEVWNIVPVCAPQNQNIEKCIALMSQIA
ncbi:hypothetical protein CANTEDRAFT_125328 [Yamadazyma tenuis ATCC 10573]|uniref:Uncharacterized protein n=2 Tax=Candida tenuis TaxID=2315449 RepID=G3B9R2_CANTC|nr:uncharacterized protein CANTEDRAFT_125328 [Yamadazyma tenuis ATCC 10573]EGV61949.1 hypothetical protein CANTEDRAFT_125328 [Yamadazyma tenuis ATCC 10573]